jgi:probable FeS assembly SUF system protein SufT
MERVELIRDVEAVQIPAGVPTTLEKGTQAFITQSLGGSFTLQVPEYGGLFRVAGKDGDAIGKEPLEAVAAGETGGDIGEQVWALLRTCYDPEIPVNIVDLGLVYDMRVTALEGADHQGAEHPGADHQVDVQMTLTAPGCGMGTSIAADARQKILGIAGVAAANVDIVWDPPWNPQMISPEGRERLGMA